MWYYQGIILLLAICTIKATQHTTQIHLSHQVYGTGFHQTYQTQFHIPHINNQTIQAIKFEWTIPSAIYLDIDELKAHTNYQIKHAHSTDLVCRYSTDEFIDVEQPQITSQHHHINVICTRHDQSLHLNDSPMTFDTPFHLRYHAPSHSTRYRDIHLEPSMVEQCYVIVFDDHQVDDINADSHRWTSASLVWSGDNDLTLWMPVASLNHQFSVGLTTFITLMCGLFVVCYSTYHSRQPQQQSTTRARTHHEQ